MDFLPISIRITHIILVGNSREALHKATILSRYTDKVTVVAPEISSEMRRLPFRFEERPFRESDLDGAPLLFICTGDADENHRIKALAESRHVLASVCDDTRHCDFISPAISHQPGDDITIAVSSDAKDVRRAIRVRNRINELINNNLLSIS